MDKLSTKPIDSEMLFEDKFKEESRFKKRPINLMMPIKSECKLCPHLFAFICFINILIIIYFGKKKNIHCQKSIYSKVMLLPVSSSLLL